MIFHHMTHPEIAAVDRSAVVILPLGSTEQHGHHLPVDTDTRIVSALCAELERRMPEQILLMPTQWLGHSPHHLDFGGTISLHHELYSRMLTEIIRCISGMGFRRILLINGHGGNMMPISMTLQAVKLENPDLLLAACSYWELAKKELTALREGGEFAMGHACELETSLYLYLHEEGVRKEKIRDAGHPDPSGYFAYTMFSGATASYLSNFRQFTDTGALGRPTLASAEKGKAMFDAISDCLFRFASFWHEKQTMDQL